jgi:hypothetical protein
MGASGSSVTLDETSDELEGVGLEEMTGGLPEACENVINGTSITQENAMAVLPGAVPLKTSVSLPAMAPNASDHTPCRCGCSMPNRADREN